MGTTFNVLIIDDHPLIIEAYKSALRFISKKYNDYDFKIKEAHDCDSAFLKIKRSLKGETIDIIFLDIKLPPAKNREILSGEDLGVIAKELLGDVKIIVSTTYTDNHRVNNILKSLNPDALLIKNDVNPKNLVEAIMSVIDGAPYYSQTVLKLLRTHILNDFVLDTIDRQLLYEISIGTKMKDLPNVLPLSIAGIERRKRHLKEAFNTLDQEDKALITIAKEKGFI